MMNLQHLYYALEVERTGSITQAAENLYMGQPNLSRAIRELEGNLGMPIFRRSPRGIVPTDKGRRFLRHARSIVEQIAQAEAIFSGEPDGLKCRVAATHTGDFAAAFSALAAEAPAEGGLELELRETELRSAIELVSGGDCPAAFVRLGNDADRLLRSMRERGLSARELGRREELITLSAAHPLAGRDEISPSELEAFTRVCLSVTHGFEPRPDNGEVGARTVVVTDRHTCLALLGEVSGAYAWLPRLDSRDLERFALCQIACPQAERHCRDYLITPEDSAPVPGVKRFAELLCARLEEQAR